MAKLFTTTLVAVGLLGLSACAKTDETAAGNAAGTSLDAGNLTDEGALGNEVTAVDGDAALSNGLDAAAVPADEGNAAVDIGNAGDATGNGL